MDRRTAVVAVLLLAVGCSSSTTATPHPSTTPSQAAPTAAGTVFELAALHGNHFSVTDIVIRVGESVHVTDRDPTIEHNFTVPGVGHSDTLGSGDTFTLRFDRAGSYTFTCTFHAVSGMKGTITVR